MRQIHYVIQTLLRGKGSIPFKVISLGLGLAMSILLFARVAYEQSYDTCFRDYNRICQRRLRAVEVWRIANENPVLSIKSE